MFVYLKELVVMVFPYILLFLTLMFVIKNSKEQIKIFRQYEEIKDLTKKIQKEFNAEITGMNKAYDGLKEEFVKEQIRANDLAKQKEHAEHKTVEYKAIAEEHYDQFLLCREQKLKMQRENDILKNIVCSIYNMKDTTEVKYFIEEQLKSTNIYDEVLNDKGE